MLTLCNSVLSQSIVKRKYESIPLSYCHFFLPCEIVFFSFNNYTSNKKVEKSVKDIFHITQNCSILKVKRRLSNA